MRKFDLFLCTLFVGCASATPVKRSIDQHTFLDQSEIEHILKTAKNADGNDPSRWTLKESTFEFRGQLVKGDCQRFIAKVGKGTNVLKVNSAGGDAFEGLCIAREMLKRNFEQTSVIDGICVSSCANYLFLGSKGRLIQNGIVGYHGNITALLKQDPHNSALRDQLLEAKVDPKEVERIAADFTKHQRSNSILEQAFLKKIGVRQELFEATQRPDKGTGDEIAYTFLLPTASTFLKYGIIRTVGDQKPELGQAMGMTNLLQ